MAKVITCLSLNGHLNYVSLMIQYRTKDISFMPDHNQDVFITFLVTEHLNAHQQADLETYLH